MKSNNNKQDDIQPHKSSEKIKVNMSENKIKSISHSIHVAKSSRVLGTYTKEDSDLHET